MNNSDRKIIEALEAMPLAQARQEILDGKYGAMGSPNHLVASTWLSVKESVLREKRDAAILRLQYWAIAIAIMATIIAAIAMMLPYLVRQ